MIVIRAQHAGACYGVQRALGLADSVLNGNSIVYTLGPLIHNPQVVGSLEARGAQVISSVDEAATGILIIRSHGVTPDVFDAAKAKGLTIVDATCPHVALAQEAAADLARQGCQVIVVGEEKHPEVAALVAHARKEGAQVFVVSAVEDLPDDLAEPVGVVVQTTQRRECLNEIVQALEQRGIKPQVKNTICYATRQRQDAAADLASKVDAMVVIGGKNSSNTSRLAEICAKHCPRTFHIESADELDPDDFAGLARVGVTAGASTPDSQIEAVISALETLPSGAIPSGAIPSEVILSEATPSEVILSEATSSGVVSSEAIHE